MHRNEQIRRLKIAESGVEYGWWVCRPVFGTVSSLSTSQPHRSSLSTLTMDRPRAPDRTCSGSAAKELYTMEASRIRNPDLAALLDEGELAWHRCITPITGHYANRIA